MLENWGKDWDNEDDSVYDELELDIETRIAIVEAGLAVADSMIRQLERKIDNLIKWGNQEPPF